jgi:hypothetical protein
VGRDGRGDAARVSRGRRRALSSGDAGAPSGAGLLSLFLPAFSMCRDLHIWFVTCGNVGLTLPWVVDTFRIAPGGPRTERRDRTKRRGSDGGRQRQPEDQAPGGTGRQRGRKVTRPGRCPPRRGRPQGRNRRPAGSAARRTQRGSVARDPHRAARPERTGPGGAGSREAPRQPPMATKAGGAPRGEPPAGDPDSPIRAEEGSEHQSPRGQREPNASAGGDRRFLGLCYVHPPASERETCATVCIRG